MLHLVSRSYTDRGINFANRPYRSLQRCSLVTSFLVLGLLLGQIGWALSMRSSAFRSHVPVEEQMVSLNASFFEEEVSPDQIIASFGANLPPALSSVTISADDFQDRKNGLAIQRYDTHPLSNYDGMTYRVYLSNSTLGLSDHLEIYTLFYTQSKISVEEAISFELSAAALNSSLYVKDSSVMASTTNTIVDCQSNGMIRLTEAYSCSSNQFLLPTSHLASEMKRHSRQDWQASTVTVGTCPTDTKVLLSSSDWCFGVPIEREV